MIALLAAVASAGPVRVLEPGTAVLDAGPATGVSARTVGPTSAAVDGPLPAGVRFRMEGVPAVERGALVVRGVLENQGSAAATVWTLFVEGGPFAVAPRGVPLVPKAVPGPGVPGSLPYAQQLVLEPGARVPYATGVLLDRWRWPPSREADLDWTFAFVGAPAASGTVHVRVP